MMFWDHHFETCGGCTSLYIAAVVETDAAVRWSELDRLEDTAAWQEYRDVDIGVDNDVYGFHASSFDEDMNASPLTRAFKDYYAQDIDALAAKEKLAAFAYRRGLTMDEDRHVLRFGYSWASWHAAFVLGGHAPSARFVNLCKTVESGPIRFEDGLDFYVDEVPTMLYEGAAEVCAVQHRALFGDDARCWRGALKFAEKMTMSPEIAVEVLALNTTPVHRIATAVYGTLRMGLDTEAHRTLFGGCLVAWEVRWNHGYRASLSDISDCPERFLEARPQDGRDCERRWRHPLRQMHTRVPTEMYAHAMMTFSQCMRRQRAVATISDAWLAYAYSPLGPGFARAMRDFQNEIEMQDL